jgi:hypothetical protein
MYTSSPSPDRSYSSTTLGWRMVFIARASWKNRLNATVSRRIDRCSSLMATARPAFS